MSATLEEHAGAPPELNVYGAITVVTPTLPGRAHLLEEARACVADQTCGTIHLVRADVERVGPAVIRSELLDEVRTEHVAFLDDDDLIDPDHLERLANALGGRELAWSWCRTVGLGAPVMPRPRSLDAALAMLAGGRNCIPVTVLARTEAIRDAGGFQPSDRYEDYALWLRMLDLGHRFVYLKRETWTYRFMGDNRTWLSR